MALVRRDPAKLAVWCRYHDSSGHHYGSADGTNDLFVLFKRSSVERVAACMMMDADVQPDWRGRHPNNDGSPDWCPAILADGSTATLILRLASAIVQSAWVEKAIETAYEMGVETERARLVDLLDTRCNILISDVPGVIPGRTGVTA